MTQLSQYNWVGEPILDNSKLVLQLNGPLDSWSPIQLVSQLTGPQLKWWVLLVWRHMWEFVGCVVVCGSVLEVSIFGAKDSTCQGVFGQV